MTASIKWDQASLFRKARRLFKALGDVSADVNLKRDLAQLTKDIVYKRVKSGKGVASDRVSIGLTRAVQLKPLSKGYK